MKLLEFAWPITKVKLEYLTEDHTNNKTAGGPDKLEKLPPQSAPSAELHALKTKMARTTDEIRSKSSALTVQDLRRLLFRCAATLISLEKVK